MLENYSTKRMLFILSIANIILWTFPFLKYIEKFEPSGDEPHYLIITQSLIQDRDLDLKNNYQNKDYQAYFQRMKLEANPKITQHKSWHPICNIGLPILSLFPFIIAGRLGVSLLMFGICVLILLNVFLIIEEIFKDRRLALYVWAICATSFPMLFYHYQIITEIPAALFCIYAYRLIMLNNTLFYSKFALAVIAFSLPWIHIKYILLVICLILTTHFIARNTIKTLSLVIPSMINLLLLLLFYNHYFGDPLFLLEIHDTSLPLFETWKGILGLMIDQEFGLLCYAPIYGIFFSGIFLVMRSAEKKHSLAFLLIFGIFWLACGAYRTWYAGWSFPARYILVIFPLLAIPIASCLKNLHSLLQKSLVIGLYCLTLPITIRTLEHPWNLYNKADGTSNLLESIKAINLSRYFPSFIDHINYLVVFSWLLFFIVINVLLSRKKPEL